MSREYVALARRLMSLQEERAGTYSRLKEAHKAYLESGGGGDGGARREYDLEAYKLAVSEATKTFQRVSQEVLEVAKKCQGEKHDAG